MTALNSRVRKLHSEERGQAIIVMALAMVMLIGAVGFAVDVGNVMGVRRALQASTDAAATAGAQDIGVTGGDPTAKALAYSAVSGNLNARTGIPNVTISTSVVCKNFMANLMTGANCAGGLPLNTIVVTQTAVVNTWFAKVLGFSTMTVVTRSTSGMKGGGMPPLDVIIVIDTTGSMGTSCSGTGTGVTSPDRLDCAKAGIRTLLNAFWPCGQEMSNCGTVTAGNVANPIDRVGLMVFPGLKSTTPVSDELDCTSNLASTEIAPYGSSPNYSIVSLSSDYKTSFNSALQGSTSDMVKAVDYGDGHGCSANGTYGLEGPGGQGSYFAGAITAAQAALVAGARTGVQRVIIFLSDGDANTYSGAPANPCRSAITAADAAATAGTWVYSVAYGASTTSGCSDDSPSITSYSTMQQIASDSSKFFNQPAAGDLTAAFKQIGNNLVNTRMLDDSVN